MSNPALEKGICIGGGVGPMAGVELHRKIVEATVTDGTDQAHLDVIHLSRSSVVGDRTQFLLGSSPCNPAAAMADTVLLGVRSLAAAGKAAVVGVPCNTFHAESIFTPFAERVKAEAGDGATVLHMLEETVAHMREALPGARTIGLMSTTGTRASKVWARLLEAHGYVPVQVPEEMQAMVHQSIYDVDFGLKAVSPASSKAVAMVEMCADRLISDGADAIILGCTELPLALTGSEYAGKPLVDPVLALARALIREAAPAKLRPGPGEG